MPSTSPPPIRKEAFLTTGATAPFPSLIRAALSPSFLSRLHTHQFTHFTLQVGTAYPLFESLLPALEGRYGLVIRAFEFDKKGLGTEMMRCKAWRRGEGEDRGEGWRRGGDGEEVREEGVVVSHAGTGSILDAMRLGLRLIVVPNEKLLDNHQEDLATELERLGYVVKSDLEGLPEALDRCMDSTPQDTSKLQPASIAPVVDEMLGYEDDPSAHLD